MQGVAGALLLGAHGCEQHQVLQAHDRRFSVSHCKYQLLYMLPAMFCMQVRLAPETCGSYVVFVVFILFFLEQSIRLKIDSRNENQERLLQQDKCVSI
jgi:hypothetical protein